MFPIWPTGNLQPLERAKFPKWNEYYQVFTKGKVNPKDPKATSGQGNAPFRVLFVDPQGSSGGIGKSTGLPLTKEGPTNNTQIVQWWDEAKNAPYKGKPQPKYVLGGTAHFNMDSMGYNGDVIKKAPTQVHWGELLNPAWKGRVALLNDPGIAMQDAGNAVKQLGLMKFKNLGNMTKPEIDGLIKLLIKYKKQGQFRAFWSTFNESVNLMSSKQVVIESMWSPSSDRPRAATRSRSCAAEAARTVTTSSSPSRFSGTSSRTPPGRRISSRRLATRSRAALSCG